MDSRSVRPVLEDVYRITIHDLYAWGILKPEKEVAAQVRLGTTPPVSFQVTTTLDSEDATGSIEFSYARNGVPINHQHVIEGVRCNFGGSRIYFVCRNCGSRVTALYLVQGYFSCRHCHQLVYRLCREHRNKYMLLHRSRDLKAKAQWLTRTNHPRKASRMNARAWWVEMAAYRPLIEYLERLGERSMRRNAKVLARVSARRGC